MDKKISLLIVGVVAVAGISFYGGMKYGQSQRMMNNFGGRMVDFSQNGGARFIQNGGSFSGGQQRGAGSGFVSGEIISLDDKSITVKLRDGGSKLVFLSGSTEIMKNASGTIQDLVKGGQVMVNGSANTDGNVTAQSIQLRPFAPPVPVQ